MKQKYYWIFGILAVAVVIFISGYIQQDQKCPKCLDQSSWSECNDQAIKTRINYKCSAETNYTCEASTEEKACATEIRIKGNKGLDAVISPTLDETVKGTIKIEALTVPERTDEVAFFLVPQGVDLGAKMTEEELAKVERGVNTNAADGWKYYIDTKKFANGIYMIFVGSTYEGAPDASPWLDYIGTQVVVEN